MNFNIIKQEQKKSVKSSKRGRGINTIQSYAQRRRLNLRGGSKKKKGKEKHERHGKEGGGAYGAVCIKKKEEVKEEGGICREERVASGGERGWLYTGFAIICLPVTLCVLFFIYLLVMIARQLVLPRCITAVQPQTFSYENKLICFLLHNHLQTVCVETTGALVVAFIDLKSFFTVSPVNVSLNTDWTTTSSIH